MTTPTTESSGVQKLIDRLHEEGVAKGRGEAEELIGAARREASEILDEARRNAEKVAAEAAADAQRTRASGEEAVRLACRDAIHTLSEELRRDFDQKLRRLIGHSLKEKDFLKQLILEIARRAVPDDAPGPKEITILNDTSSGAASGPLLDEGQLSEFVKSLSGEALREGLTVEVDDAEIPGVRLRIVDEDVEVDLTTETLTHLLLKHLSPTFRAIVEQ